MCVCKRERDRERGEKEVRRRVLTQKPVLIMKNSIEPPIMADTTAIFKYQSRNFIVLLSLCSLSLSLRSKRRIHIDFLECWVLGDLDLFGLRSYLTRPESNLIGAVLLGTQHPQPIRLSISRSKTAHYY